MRERVAQILKIVCLALVALLVVQLVKVANRANPLANAAIPDVPSLPADTNAPPTVANKAPARPGTNVSLVMSSNAPGITVTSNAPGAATDTNAVAHRKAKPSDSNAAPITVAGEPAGSNTNNLQTNAEIAVSTETNAVSPRKRKVAGSNVVTAAEPSSTNSSPTNTMAVADTNGALAKTSIDTNAALVKIVVGTNGVAIESAKTNGTNVAMAKASAARRPPNIPPQMMGQMGGPGGAKAVKLPPEIQARVDRVVESEILAPINHPMPMALLGVAGKSALIRSPSGQTGMIKEGEDLGEIKLLRIGINRVLVEQDGQPKELMIFSGLGGESLLPKPTVTSDETTKK